MSNKIRNFTANGFNQTAPRLLQPNEIRIKAAGYGLNRLDIELMERSPDLVAGLEVAGIVTEIGSEVRVFARGDRVMSLVSEGGFSESVIAEEHCSLHVPNSLDLSQAAVLPEALFTVWLNLFELGRARRGESVLITGAAGGIGVHAALVARELGLSTIVSSRSQDRLKALERLGFAHTALTIDGRISLASNSVDVIFDLLGPRMYPEYFSALRNGGRITMIDALLGDEGPVHFGHVFEKSLLITGSLLRPQPAKVKERIRDALSEQIIPKLENRSIFPVIGKTFKSFGELPEALEYLRTEPVFGKVLVRA